jgi:hypothetical protein
MAHVLEVTDISQHGEDGFDSALPNPTAT